MPNKKSKRKKGFTTVDWLIIGFFVILLIVPDPLDFLTFGIPILEALSAFIYVAVRSHRS